MGYTNESEKSVYVEKELSELMRYMKTYSSVKVQILQHNIDMKIDHFVNMLS